MADNKLEQMLEKLVNNDRTGADELFHEFVIEKSRGIYEKMLETDLEDLDEVKDEEVDESSDDEETNEASDEEVDESSDDEETNEATDEEVDESDEDLDETTDEEVDENFGEFTPEADPMGGDAGDAMMKDIEAGGEEGGRGAAAVAHVVEAEGEHKRGLHDAVEEGEIDHKGVLGVLDPLSVDRLRVAVDGGYDGPHEVSGELLVRLEESAVESAVGGLPEDGGCDDDEYGRQRDGGDCGSEEQRECVFE